MYRAKGSQSKYRSPTVNTKTSVPVSSTLFHQFNSTKVSSVTGWTNSYACFVFIFVNHWLRVYLCAFPVSLYPHNWGWIRFHCCFVLGYFHKRKALKNTRGMLKRMYCMRTRNMFASRNKTVCIFWRCRTTVFAIRNCLVRAREDAIRSHWIDINNTKWIKVTTIITTQNGHILTTNVWNHNLHEQYIKQNEIIYLKKKVCPIITK